MDNYRTLGEYLSFWSHEYVMTPALKDPQIWKPHNISVIIGRDDGFVVYIYTYGMALQDLQQWSISRCSPTHIYQYVLLQHETIAAATNMSYTYKS